MKKKIKLWTLTISTGLLLIRGGVGDFSLCLWYRETNFET